MGVGRALDGRWMGFGRALNERWTGDGRALDWHWMGVGWALKEESQKNQPQKKNVMQIFVLYLLGMQTMSLMQSLLAKTHAKFMFVVRVSHFSIMKIHS